jgi:signal transduction histidine kinase
VDSQIPRKAYYSYIPPGDYQFAVRACNNDGQWNNEGASLAFRVQPAFWQTVWFRATGGMLTAVAGGLVVWLDARRRMRRKLERLEREQAIERERSRIARDIHDDLGAGLTRISLLSDSVSPDELPANPATEALGRIFATTHELTQAMDEIVWAVNPQHDTLDSLAVYLGKFAQDFLESAGIRCRLDLPMRLPNWRLDAELRHNVFLAFKECLNNVARHAMATEVRVSLSTTTDSFTLLVEDNGRGLIVEEARSAGTVRPAARNGLANMRQRLSQIGGQCEIASARGKGTRVEFRVAAKPAGK